MLHRLDPAEPAEPKRVTDAGLRAARERIALLLRAAQESLDKLYLAVGGVGCCVLLADRDGVPLERRGAPSDDSMFQEWGLWPGALWSEESEGTNGIGTCLVEQRPVTIHRDEHFLARNTLLSCTTAPIFDHEGELVAAIDVSSCRADLTAGFVHLIALALAEAARRVEAENFRLSFPGARILLPPVNDRFAGALIAVNSDDLVIGATRAARMALGLGGLILQPLPVSDIIGESKRAEDLDDAERAALRRALARAEGNVSAAAQSLGISRATLHRKLNRFGVR